MRPPGIALLYPACDRNLIPSPRLEPVQRFTYGRNAQSTQVIQSLRVGDLVGLCQQPEQRYEVLTVDEQRLLAARFIAVRDVVVPF